MEWLDPPRVWPYCKFYWDAFFALGSTRQIGMAEGPIPFTAIDAYARRYGLDGDDFEIFLAIMRGMDAEYLVFRADRARQAQELNEQFRKEKPKPKLVLPKVLAGEG